MDQVAVLDQSGTNAISLWPSARVVAQAGIPFVGTVLGAHHGGLPQLAPFLDEAVEHPRRLGTVLLDDEVVDGQHLEAAVVSQPLVVLLQVFALLDEQLVHQVHVIDEQGAVVAPAGLHAERPQEVGLSRIALADHRHVLAVGDELEGPELVDDVFIVDPFLPASQVLHRCILADHPADPQVPLEPLVAMQQVLAGHHLPHQLKGIEVHPLGAAHQFIEAAAHLSQSQVVEHQLDVLRVLSHCNPPLPSPLGDRGSPRWNSGTHQPCRV